MKVVTIIFTLVLLFSWSGISGAESSSESKTKTNQFTGESTKSRSTATKVFGRIIGITVGAAMDAGLAVAGFSWARSGSANIYTQVFTEHAASGLLGTKGAGGVVLGKVGGETLGYQQYKVTGHPAIVGSADVDNTLTVAPTQTGEIIGDKMGNLFLCYNEGCKQIQGAVLLIASEEAAEEGTTEVSTDGSTAEPQTESIQAKGTAKAPPTIQPVNTEMSNPAVQPAVYPLARSLTLHGTPQKEEIRTASVPGSPFGISPRTANP